MSRIMLVAALACLPLTVLAKGQPPEGKKAAAKDDCAAYLKTKAPIANKLAEYHSQVAENLEAHMASLRMNPDPAAKAELALLGKLVKQHQQASAGMKQIAWELDHASFPPTHHDMSKMDQTQMNEAMMKQVKLEKEVSNLFRKDAAQTQKMMAAKKPPKKASR